jgi:hypothetical protein
MKCVQAEPILGVGSVGYVLRPGYDVAGIQEFGRISSGYAALIAISG